MQLFEWDTVRREDMNTKIWRKVIMGEKITLAQLSIAKGGVVPLHHHENEQISWLAEGALEFTVGDDKIILRKGGVIHIPPHVPHSVVALEDTLSIEIFSPIRQDWLSGTDDYLRQKADS